MKPPIHAGIFSISPKAAPGLQGRILLVAKGNKAVRSIAEADTRSDKPHLREAADLPFPTIFPPPLCLCSLPTTGVQYCSSYLGRHLSLFSRLSQRKAPLPTCTCRHIVERARSALASFQVGERKVERTELSAGSPFIAARARVVVGRKGVARPTPGAQTLTAEPQVQLYVLCRMRLLGARLVLLPARSLRVR